jgi:hypothetical protein
MAAWQLLRAGIRTIVVGGCGLCVLALLYLLVQNMPNQRSPWDQL